MLGEALALGAALTWVISVILFKRSEEISPLGLNLFKNVLTVLLLVITLCVLGEGIELGNVSIPPSGTPPPSPSRRRRPCRAGQRVVCFSVQSFTNSRHIEFLQRNALFFLANISSRHAVELLFCCS